METIPIIFHITGKLKTGEEACPRFFDAREVMFLIDRFDKIIIPMIGANRSKTTIGFQVEEGSERLKWFAPAVVATVFFANMAALKNQEFAKVNPISLKAISEIHHRYKDDNLNIEIGNEDHPNMFSLNKDTYLEVPKDNWLETESVLYGTIENLGGTKPNFHIRTENGIIIVTANQNEIIDLQKSVPLYNQEIEVAVSCIENITTGDQKEFKFINFRTITSSVNQKALASDIRAGTNIWGNITDAVQWVQTQRT